MGGRGRATTLISVYALNGSSDKKTGVGRDSRVEGVFFPVYESWEAILNQFEI